MVTTSTNIKNNNNNHSSSDYNCSDQNSDEEDKMPTTTASTTCCCLTCCYDTDMRASSTATRRRKCIKPKTSKRSISTSSSSSSSSESRDPPSEAAAFVASASAAAFVLLVALLAVVLSSMALMAVTFAMPVADAAADVRLGTQTAADCPHQWHQQQQHQSNRPSVHRQQQQRVRYVNDDPSRQKRQLFKKNVNREPGIIGLTFSLIGGTVSDVRQAFRNVSGIVRDTISEVAKAQEPVVTPSADGDPMMMAAGNSVENEIGGGSNGTSAAPVDQRVAGQALGKLLGRNYRGLRRLFNTELRSALKSSPGNVRDFASELVGSIGQSLRPSNLISRGPIATNVTTTGR